MPRPTTEDKEKDEANPVWLERTLPEELETALKESVRGSWSEVYPVEFSVIDAATYEYLPSLVRGFEKIKRKQLTTGSVEYIISNEAEGSRADDAVGPLGSVRIRKLDERLTELAFQDPPRPNRRTLTREERAEIENIPDQHDRDRAILASEKKRRAEQDAHHRWRRAYHAALVRGFLQRLRDEREWVATFPEVGGRAAPADANQRRWRHAEDRWLWEQVNVHGLPLKHVVDEWTKKSAKRNLKAPYDTAKKIIQRSR